MADECPPHDFAPPDGVCSRCGAENPDREVTMSAERLHELVYTAVGAASVPFMRDNPSYVMPTEELTESTQQILREFGVEPVVGYDPPLPDLKPREAGDMVSAHEIAVYLDQAIRNWRRVRDGQAAVPDGLATTFDALIHTDSATAGTIALASLYVDAFQSARVSLLGEELA